MKLTPMNSWRSVARLSALKALYLKRHGNDREALEIALKVVDVGQNIQESQGSLIEYLIALAIKGIGLQAAHQIVIQSTTLSPELLTNYINKLEHYKNNENGLKIVWKVEYLLHLNGIDSITSYGKLNFFYLQPNRIKNLETQFAKIRIDNTNIPCAFIKDEIESTDRQSFFRSIITENFIGQALFSAANNSLNSVNNKKCQEDLIVSSTQLTAALKAHWLENGSYPPLLEALTPKYISVVPTDPFDSEPIRYSKDKKIIYSVGEDGIDSGGSVGDDWRKMPDPTFSVDFAPSASTEAL